MAALTWVNVQMSGVASCILAAWFGCFARKGDSTIFSDRSEAGRSLAAKIPQIDAANAVVVALPRGGLPVAAEVARLLRLPLDIALVRKVGAPGQPELAVAAVSNGAGMELTINRDVAGMLGLSDARIERLARQELPELERRQQLYCGDRPPLQVSGKTVILVDDGVATGATARAALRILRKRGAARVILALPVAPAETLEELKGEADEVVCLHAPSPFFAVGAHYIDFRQVSDSEVKRILEGARAEFGRQEADRPGPETARRP